MGRISVRFCQAEDLNFVEVNFMMNKKYLSMAIIGVTLCIMACVNLLLNTNSLLAFIQIVFGIPFVVIGFRKIKK